MSEKSRLKTGLTYLEKALSSNLELRELVLGNYVDEYLKILEGLLEELYNNACKGIELKMHETALDLYRFQSTVSELEFARYFVRSNMHVGLLSSNVFQGRKAPDIYAKSNSREYFVEVKNIQFDDEDYNFGKEIAATLNSLGLHFMVIVKSLVSLATPTYAYQTREQKEVLCKKSLDEFKDALKDSSSDSSPITVQTTIAKVELHPTKIGKSYMGIGAMAQAIGEPLDYRDKVRDDIKEKSKKREEWIDNELDRFYIVAIDDDTMFFYIDRYNMELFGTSTYYTPPLAVPDAKITPQVEKAIKNGWTDYLQRMCVLPNNRCVILEENRGLFFSEPLMKNVSAVLVQHNNVFYLVANPFAEDGINSPDIFQELKNCSIGWE
jgi:hypothetical protein